MRWGKAGSVVTGRPERRRTDAAALAAQAAACSLPKLLDPEEQSLAMEVSLGAMSAVSAGAAGREAERREMSRRGGSMDER